MQLQQVFALLLPLTLALVYQVLQTRCIIGGTFKSWALQQSLGICSKTVPWVV